MRKKTTRAAAALALVLMMGLMAGCGSGFDPAALVKANLDYMTTGEITEEILTTTNQTEEELTALYEADIEEAVDTLVSGMGIEEYVTDERVGLVEDFIKKAYAKAKYEVSEEYTEEEGAYYVDVTVYPMDFLQKAEDYIMGDYVDDWGERIESGEYTYTTQEQLMMDVYDELLTYLNEQIESTGYLDAETVTIAVKEVDGKYMPDTADLAELGAKMLGQ